MICSICKKEFESIEIYLDEIETQTILVCKSCIYKLNKAAEDSPYRYSNVRPPKEKKKPVIDPDAPPRLTRKQRKELKEKTRKEKERKKKQREWGL